MKTARVISLILLAYLTFGCATPGNSNQTGKAAITWYTGGEAKLSLDPIPVDLSSSLVLAGATTQKTLVVKVAKKGGTARSNPVPLAADGSFNVRYLIKDGIGTYTVTLFGSSQKNALNYQGLGFFTLTVTKALPANLLHLELNGEVLAFVNGVMGTQVGSGECWDLAQQALDTSLADWTRPTSFGLPLNPEKDEIKAGDIIQFRSVKTTEHLPGGGTRWETLGAPDHTAIVYKVLGKKRYTLAHQNIGGKRIVLTSDINLAKVTGGKYWIYRPVALMIRK
ncbi:MAG: hypothetical protein A2076_04590 [Geobacteraceae bacterium GWC2_53_11]|nr:MAG: hypothetical protein A2076_04590 [Geobacteraceae bacterium GWC2_53_11]